MIAKTKLERKVALALELIGFRCGSVTDLSTHLYLELPTASPSDKMRALKYAICVGLKKVEVLGL